MDSNTGTISAVGIDTGGTFTDLVWIRDGKLRTAKVPSKPDSPAEAVLDGLRYVSAVPELICHGSTVGTNAVLARSGGPAAMVVTRGFRDVLNLGRGDRLDLYSLSPGREKPLLDRCAIFEVNLRLDSNGKVLSCPEDFEIEEISKQIMLSGAKAIALGILHSAQYPEAEKKLASQIENISGIKVFPSSAITSFPAEYERWTAASMAAYIAPVLGSYMAELASRCESRLGLMASSGGLISTETALANPALCVLSGPAGGVLAAMAFGSNKAIALDMGGTSTDVTLINGCIPRSREQKINELPLPLPTVDIHTIGAGGGSIVKVDSGGMLSLGPQSAGAEPGPAAYGKGGPLTLTDAAILAGRIATDRFLGGRMKIDVESARNAFEQVCPKGLDKDDFLDGILELARVHLIGAIRKVSIGRGIDPSKSAENFALVPFGGAGGLFAVECARDMNLGRIIHPHCSGVFSALGLLLAQVFIEKEQALLVPIKNAVEEIERFRKEAESEIVSRLKEWDEKCAPVFELTVEMRYRGQTSALDVSIKDELDSTTLIRRFEDQYQSRYTYLHKDAPIEVVAVRLRGEISLRKFDFPDIELKNRSLKTAVAGRQTVRADRKWIDAVLYDRDLIPIEEEITGPALIAENYSVLYLPPDSAMYLDRKGHGIVNV